MKTYDVAIIGGGAAGLMCAYILSSELTGVNIAVIEHNSVPGKKLKATGNGRCNYTNEIIDAESYRGNTPSFAYEIIKKYDKDFIIDLMNNMGIKSTSINGYYYPRSLQASTVVNALYSGSLGFGAEVLLDTDVTAVVECNDDSCKYIIKTSKEDIYADRVVIAAGGMSSRVFGSDGSGYNIAKKLGHTITPLYPSLTGLKTEGINNKISNGVRARGTIGLYADDRLLSESKGEIQFAAYGISGIPVFQICRYAAKAIKQKKDVYAVIDLIPEYDILTVKDDLGRIIDSNSYISIADALNAYIPDKLARVILDRIHIPIGSKSRKITSEMLINIASELKALKLKVTDSCGFDNAQVTAGGVDTSCINASTMCSTLKDDLYFIGEILDVDGNCGGYNLHFAFATAYICARAIIYDIKGQNNAN